MLPPWTCSITWTTPSVSYERNTESRWGGTPRYRPLAATLATFDDDGKVEIDLPWASPNPSEETALGDAIALLGLPTDTLPSKLRGERYLILGAERPSPSPMFTCQGNVRPDQRDATQQDALTTLVSRMSVVDHCSSQYAASAGEVSRANQPNTPPRITQNSVSPTKEMTRKVHIRSAGISTGSGLAGRTV